MLTSLFALVPFRTPDLTGVPACVRLCHYSRRGRRVHHETHVYLSSVVFTSSACRFFQLTPRHCFSSRSEIARQSSSTPKRESSRHITPQSRASLAAFMGLLSSKGCACTSDFPPPSALAISPRPANCFTNRSRRSFTQRASQHRVAGALERVAQAGGVLAWPSVLHACSRARVCQNVGRRSHWRSLPRALWTRTLDRKGRAGSGPSVPRAMSS